MLEEIFKRMCEIRYFELGLISASKRGLIKCPMYLSTGQEAVAASFSVICPEYRVFSQHRGNSWYLAYGGDPTRLRDEFLGFKTGCSGGMGGSDVQCERMEAHHGLIGENAPIGVGYAFATKKPTIIVMGDGSIEEDCFLTSVGFAKTHNLPVLFVVEDNNLAILTKVKERRNWSIVEVAKGFGVNAIDIEDNPLRITNLDIKLPMLLNIRTERHHWHVGGGQDNPPEIDRLAQFRRGFENIEKKAKKKMEGVWRL